MSQICFHNSYTGMCPLTFVLLAPLNSYLLYSHPSFCNSYLLLMSHFSDQFSFSLSFPFPLHHLSHKHNVYIFAVMTDSVMIITPAEPSNIIFIAILMLLREMSAGAMYLNKEVEQKLERDLHGRTRSS